MRNTKSFLFSWILGALFILFLYLPLLLSSEWTLLYRDISHYFLPLKHLWVSGVREQGSIPHWNPYHYGGTPFLSDCGPGPLYVFNWLLLLFPTEKLTDALVFFIQLHHQLIFAGFLLLFRQWRVRAPLAGIGALLLALGGFAMSSDSLLHILGAQTAIPFLLFFWTRFRREHSSAHLGLSNSNNGQRKARALLSLYLCSVFLAWPIYAGDPQFTYIAALFLLVDLIRLKLRWPEKIRAYSLLGALTILHSAPQLLPTIDFLRETSRGMGRTGIADLLYWSMHPVRYLESIFPLAFGRSANLEEYWGHVLLNSEPRKHPYIFSLYAGFLPWIFFLWQLPQQWKQMRKSWRFALPASGFAVLTVCTWGAFSPLPIYEWFAHYFPFWNSFRHPERLAYWVVLGIGISGVLGAEKFLRLKKWSWARPTLHWVALPLAVAAFFSAIYLQKNSASLLPVFLSGALIGFTIFSLRKEMRPHLQIAILLLAVFDLLYFSSSLVWPFPKKFTKQKTYPWVEELTQDRQKQLLHGGAHRLFSSRDGQLDWKYAEPQWRTMDLNLFFDWALLTPNIPAVFGQPDLGGFFTLAPVKVPDLQQWVGAKDFGKMLDLFSVRYFLALKDGSPKVQLNEDAIPYVATGLRVKILPEENLIPRYLVDPQWIPQQELVMASKGDPANDLSAATISTESATAPNWRVEKISKSFDSLKIQLSGDFSRPGWVLINESFHKYWQGKVTSPQVALPLEQANGWAIAALVPANLTQNSVELELTYQNPWYYRGLWALFLWVLFGFYFAAKVVMATRAEKASSVKSA